MSATILNLLAGETVVHSNPLATVTRNCVVIREGARGAHAVIGVQRVTGIRKVTTSTPGLLVISCGLLTISAASYASKQGLEVSLIIAFIAALFVMGYVGSRRAAVLFLLGSESIESAQGSFREATSVIRALYRVRGDDPQTSLPTAA